MAKIGAAFVLGLFVAGPFAAALKLEVEPALEVTTRLTALETYTLRTKGIIAELEKTSKTARGNLTQLPPVVSGLLDTLIDTLLQPVQDAVNNSLTQLNEKVDLLVPLLHQKKEHLLDVARTGWHNFIVELNSTLWDSEHLWGQVPWQMITTSLDSIGASDQVPHALRLSLEVLANVTNTMAEFREFGPTLLQSRAEMAQDMASTYIQPYFQKLLNLMPTLQSQKENLKTAFGTLVSNIDTWLHQIPGASWVPESVFSNVNTMLQGLQVVVDHVADQAYLSVNELVHGLQAALDIVLVHEGVAPIATAPGGAPRAARLGGLITTATLVLGLKGLP
jgi:hypothetical protein